MKRAQLLAKQLRPLASAALAHVAGGEFASTSTSGTPEAGDDTIGDRLTPIFIPVQPSCIK